MAIRFISTMVGSTRLAIALLTSLCLLVQSTQGAEDIEVTIEELGSPEAPQWEVSIRRFGRGDEPVLSGPNGLVLSENSEFWNPSTLEWRLPYPSYEAVATALEGSWTLEVEDRFGSPRGQTMETHEFRFEDLFNAEVSRLAPTNLNLSDPAFIANGSEFLMSWDQPGASDQGAFLQLIPMFPSGFSLHRSGFGIPSPGSMSSGSTSTGAGDRMFTSTHRNEPGATTPRWIFTLTASDTALPLDIELTLGTKTSLQDRVWTRGRPGGPGFFNDTDVTLQYLRIGERLTVQLIVPEPVSGVLLGSVLIPLVAHRRKPRAAPLKRR